MAKPFSILTTYYTTPFNEWRANNPALTTIYTPNADCKDRWVLPKSTPNALNQWFIFSTGRMVDPANTMTDELYATCQPLGHEGYYSPGACPHEQTIATGMEIRFSASGSLQKYWKAWCCRT